MYKVMWLPDRYIILYYTTCDSLPAICLRYVFEDATSIWEIRLKTDIQCDFPCDLPDKCWTVSENATSKSNDRSRDPIKRL